ncbi:RNase P modulator RnpM [Thermorudis peleae]|uniref:RNase P modulator RnpM n=1 Tax=Thermorudis peleae TaxID=1382356 RepID=UPI0006925B50|nr:YlxR family protein [Thermorudis peleae]MBX6754123.1 YlxR family protein [Thermorudis peleae]
MPEPTKRRKQPRLKHIPLRTCVVCHTKDAKRTFVRIVRTPEGTLAIDPTGKRNGRGAYLCRRFRCWELAAQTDALDRALRTTVPPEFRAELLRYADLHIRRDDTPDLATTSPAYSDAELKEATNEPENQA